MNYTHIIELFRCSNKIIIFLFMALSSVNVHADGWAIFSQHDQMKNYVIVEVGSVSTVAPPFNTKWENDVYQMNGRCFVFDGYIGYWGYGDKAALLLVNENKYIQLALVTSEIGSVKVELESITLIKCPSGSEIIPYSSDPEERLKQLKRKQELLKKKLESFKQKK